MKKLFLIIVFVVVIVCVASYFVISKNTEPVNQELESTKRSVEVAQIGDFEFSYTDSPDDYILVKDHQTWPENIISSASIFKTDDYKMFMQPDFVGETTPSLIISVYENESKLLPLEWAQENYLASNFELDQRSEVELFTVSGVEGITYHVFGLYRFDVYVFSYKDQIYLLSAAYDDVGDAYYVDYKEVINTASFK